MAQPNLETTSLSELLAVAVTPQLDAEIQDVLDRAGIHLKTRYGSKEITVFGSKNGFSNPYEVRQVSQIVCAYLEVVAGQNNWIPYR